jgi:hypothetical protein
MDIKKISKSSTKAISTKNSVFLTLFALLHIIVLYPIINTPLGADDIWKSTSPSILKSQDKSLLNDSFEKISYWIEHGRMLIVASGIEPFLYYFVDVRVLYKMTLILLIFILHFTVYYLIRVAGISKMHAIFAILFLLSLSQIRNFFDARIHFAGIVIICNLLLLASLIFLFKLIQGNNRSSTQICYVLFTILAIFSYETNIAILFPIVSYLLIKNRKILTRVKTLTIATPIILGVLSAFFIRLNAKFIESDASISLNVSKVLSALKIQLLGTIPNTSFNGVDVFHFGKGTYLVITLSIVLLYMCGASISSIGKCGILHQEKTKGESVDLVFIGITLLLVPSILIALTPRFQMELSPGLPYATVIFQQVGSAIYFSTIFGKKVITQNLAKILVTMFLAVTVSTNYWVTKTPQPFEGSAMLDNQKFGWDREVVERFFRSESLPRTKQYYTFPQRAWTTSPYLSDISGREIEILNAPAWWSGSDVKVSRICTENCEHEKILTFKGWSYSSGVVAISNFTLSKFDSAKNRYLSWGGIMYLDGLTEKATTALNCVAYRDGKYTSSIRGNRVSIDVTNFGKYLIIEYRTLDARVVDPLLLANLIKTCKLTI